MRIMALGYVGWESPNYKEFESFGPDVFGLGLGETGVDGTVYLRMDDRPHRLAIHPGENDRLAYIGWELAGHEAFSGALRHLEHHRVPYELGDEDDLYERSLQGLARFSDPAGFVHEIFYGPTFTPGSFIPGKPMAGGFIAGSSGVGHVVTMVPDLTAELEHFVTEVLGFQLFGGHLTTMEDGTKVGPQFYRCNARTHCFAYVAAPGVQGGHHVCIEVESLDDVGRAWDIVQDRDDIPIVMTLGRHALDTLISFYIRTPGGFDMEFGAGGMELDDDSFVQLNPSHHEVWGHRWATSGLPGTVKPVLAGRP